MGNEAKIFIITILGWGNVHFSGEENLFDNTNL